MVSVVLRGWVPCWVLGWLKICWAAAPMTPTRELVGRERSVREGNSQLEAHAPRGSRHTPTPQDGCSGSGSHGGVGAFSELDFRELIDCHASDDCALILEHNDVVS